MRNLTLILLLLSANISVQADTATGKVFLDANRNGSLDAGEPGIEGVRVSNGIDVTLTDADGRYEISAAPPTIIFITKPQNYATPVNSDQLPQFYYIHQPEGSPPGLRYAGVSPTGPLPSSVNFPLIERPEEKKFEAILFADTQPQTDRELDYIRDDVIAELIGSPAAFGMTMGDILFDDLSMFPRYNALIAQIGIPWYNVPGNHELNFAANSDAESLETFKRFYGPTYYAFEYADALFVVLDNIEYNGSGAAKADDVRGNGGYEASLNRQQLEWLENELSFVADDKLVFIATHAPLGNESGTYATKNRNKLFKLLAGRENLYSVAGHTHTTDHVYFGKEEGFAGPGEFHHHILATVSGSWWSGPFDERGVAVSDQRDGTPNGYHILEVDSTDVVVRFKGAGKPADYQMRILFDVSYHGLEANGLRDYQTGQLFDGRLNQDQLSATTLLVNLFNGGPKSKIRYRINDREYQPLTRVLRKDPYMIEQFARHAESKKSWVDATPSTHIYQTRLPTDLTPGTYTVTVEATDEFGLLHHAHTILEVVAGQPSPEQTIAYPGD